MNNMKIALRRWLPAALVVACVLAPGCRKEEISLGAFEGTRLPVAGDCRSVQFLTAAEGAVVGGRPFGGGFIASTSDGGLTWRIDTLLANRLECVRFDATGQAYAVGMDGLALYRPPGGTYWQYFRVDWVWYRAAHFVDARHGVLVGGEGYVQGFARRCGPAFWQADTLQRFDHELGDVRFSDSLTVHAVGIGWIMRSTDAGRNWERRPASGDFFRSVHFPTPDTGYVCGSSGALLKSTDGGLTWQTLRRAGGGPAFRCLYFATARRGYAVGDDGLFRRTDDGGDTWAQVAEAPRHVDFTAVQAVGGQGWVVAKNGMVFRFRDP
jgi:photosystem II stability/assembly factor-like uncharacterized protein